MRQLALADAGELLVIRDEARRNGKLAAQQPEVAAKASSAASSPPGDLSVEEMKAAADALTAQRLSTASAHAALIKAATAAAADRKQLEEEAQLQNSKARASAGELR